MASSKYKPFKIITHQDLDGGCSAIVIINYLLNKYGKNIQYAVGFKTYTNVDLYTEQILNNNIFQEIIIADISVQEHVAKDFPDNLMLFDHHDTATHLSQYKNCIVDTSGKLCGATLCYQELMKKNGYENKEVETLARIADDYDNWRNKLPNKVAKNLNFLFYHYWGEKFIERYKNGFNGFTEYEKTFLKDKWSKIKSDIKNLQETDLLADDPINKNKVAFVILKDESDEINELADYLLVNKGYQVAILANARLKRVSIRANKKITTPDFHIGKINEEFVMNSNVRGGGHSHAGGLGYTDMENLEKICQTYVDKILELQL
jgi:oligoribonuclease NrnB/cAMP/cGMP phosphodiesterase (DHH superfamily)